jgi:hypothetical protein
MVSRMVALVLFRMSPEYSTPARINTKGFRKSDGFMVIQNAGIPYRTMIPRISERIVIIECLTVCRSFHGILQLA